MQQQLLEGGMPNDMSNLQGNGTNGGLGNPIG